MGKEYNLDDELGIGSLFDDLMGDSMEYYPPQFTKLSKKEREYVLTMAYRETHVPEVKFSPLTHCALCGKMFPSIAVSIRNHVPLNFTINHACFWDEPVCNCE